MCRKALKIAQPHLAELAWVSMNSLYRIERGEAFYRKKEQLIMSALLKEKVLGESAVQS
jgi:hypothetical protein